MHDVPVVCEQDELAVFDAPPGESCDQYAGSYVQQAGGYVITVDGQCGICQYANGDEFVSSPLSSLYSPPPVLVSFESRLEYSIISTLFFFP